MTGRDGEGQGQGTSETTVPVVSGTDAAEIEVELRPWAGDIKTDKRVTHEFIAIYRKAFDADPDAKFCVGEIDGITLIVAVGDTGQRLQRILEDIFGATIQRPPSPTSTTSSSAASEDVAPAPDAGVS